MDQCQSDVMQEDDANSLVFRAFPSTSPFAWKAPLPSHPESAGKRAELALIFLRAPRSEEPPCSVSQPSSYCTFYISRVPGDEVPACVKDLMGLLWAPQGPRGVCVMGFPRGLCVDRV